MRIAACLLLLLPIGCATTPQAYAPVSDVRYAAIGEQPFWMLNIGDDRIVFRPVNGDRERAWPRTLPRTQDGRRTWTSGEGSEAIIVEARPGPCSLDDERSFEDFVEIRMGEDGAVLNGCGGRMLGRGRG